tara:strand:- start:53 stop:277 length:225 start_codon:yes stop_codon:yes gene_type:complete
MFPDKDLFHYTSADAFLGIMTNRVIWASNIALLNDEQEYRYTTEVLTRISHRLPTSLADRSTYRHTGSAQALIA